MGVEEYRTDTGEDKAWRELAARDPDAVCRNAIASLDPGTGFYTIDIFGESHLVDPAGRKILNVANPQRPPEYLLNLSTPLYLTGARPIPPSGELVKEFKGGEFFFRGSHTLPLGTIAEAYGKEGTGAFEKACIDELGGVEAGIGDKGFRFLAYPRISMTIVLWHADEEFAARAALLFDTNADKHVALDTLWAVALVACQRLINRASAGQPGAAAAE